MSVSDVSGIERATRLTNSAQNTLERAQGDFSRQIQSALSALDGQAESVLTAQVQAASAGTASTAAAAGAQIYDVTLTTALADGTTRIAILNDDVAAINSADTLIDLTGVTGALNAQDFIFA